MLKTLEVIVRGRVQGVGYRAFAVKNAKKFGIVGYVENLPDDTVKVIAQGKEDNLYFFVHTLKQGPLFCSVKEYAVAEIEHSRDYEDFIVLY
jgi:acylphosphatase